MPLDPHLAGVLHLMATSGKKPIYEGSPQEGRDGYRALTVGTRTPEQVVPVASVQDAQVDGATGRLKARIYRPEGAGPFPTVAFFHGGGWVIGDLDTHDNMCRDICRGAQAVVVSVDYRLAPEHPFPAGVEDAVAATRWVQAHASALGGNNIVGIAGDSAGGNLSAVVTQQLRDAGTPLAAQFLIYPAVDHSAARYPSMMQNDRGYFLELDSMIWFYQHYAGNYHDTLDIRLAPLRSRQMGGLPPAVIVTAEFDPLRDEGAAYATSLLAAGGLADHIPCPGMIHGFFDMGRWSPAAQTLITRCTRRFGEVLRGR
jgi:acetyl esterase